MNNSKTAAKICKKCGQEIEGQAYYIFGDGPIHSKCAPSPVDEMKAGSMLPRYLSSDEIFSNRKTDIRLGNLLLEAFLLENNLLEKGHHTIMHMRESVSGWWVVEFAIAMKDYVGEPATVRAEGSEFEIALLDAITSLKIYIKEAFNVEGS